MSLLWGVRQLWLSKKIRYNKTPYGSWKNNCVSRELVNEENKYQSESVLLWVRQSRLSKNFFSNRTPKEIETKLHLQKIWQLREWAPDQVCTMTGSVVMIFKQIFIQWNPLMKWGKKMCFYSIGQI